MTDLIILFIGVIFGVGASAITFRIPASELFWATCTGILGWEVLAGLQFYDFQTLSATTLGALTVSLVAEILARDRKVPAPIYTVPAILPLVPGRASYNAMLFLIKGDYHQAANDGFEALLGAGGISIGLLMGSAMARAWLHPAHRHSPNLIKRDEEIEEHQAPPSVGQLHRLKQERLRRQHLLAKGTLSATKASVAPIGSAVATAATTATNAETSPDTAAATTTPAPTEGATGQAPDRPKQVMVRENLITLPERRGHAKRRHARLAHRRRYANGGPSRQETR